MKAGSTMPHRPVFTNPETPPAVSSNLHENLTFVRSLLRLWWLLFSETVRWSWSKKGTIPRT